MEKNLAQKYDHKAVEEGKYNRWIEKGYFTAGDKSKDPFTIVIPPPNVTGILHIGHAWDNTLRILLRVISVCRAMTCCFCQVWIMRVLRHRQRLMHA